MIRLKHVKKTFNRRKANETRAINDTTVVLPDTGLITFLGESGCGKTTLLNAIGGLDKVDSGEIYVDGERLTRRTSGKRDDIRSRKIGYIFQNYNLIEDATVFENVALVLKMTGFTDRAAIERRVMYVLDRVGIARYRNRPAKMLSGGERQRVGIARAIVKNPAIIIADEPTGNLDSGNTIEVMNIIKAISKEKLVILVTHERSVAEFYADRILEIVDGKIVSDRENHAEKSLHYQIDNRIYLQDMAVQKDLSQDGVNVRLYSSRPVSEIPPIKVVIRGNRLYVDTEGILDQGSEAVELIDDHYRDMSKDDYENYEFHYDDYYRNAEAQEGLPRSSGVPREPKYHRIFGPFSSLGSGFRTVHHYSKLKKVLLVGFVLASMFVLYAVSNIAGVLHVTDDRFVEVDKDYLTVKSTSVTPEKLAEFQQMDGVDYVMAGDSRVTLPVPLTDYDQLNDYPAEISNVSLSSTAKLKKSDLIAGRLPSGDHEIVVDKLALNNAIGLDSYLTSYGLTTAKKFVGQTVRIPYLGDYKIVGVSDRSEPCAYFDPGQFPLVTAVLSDEQMDLSTVSSLTHPEAQEGQLLSYSFIQNDSTIQITKGSAPTGEYQVLIPSSMADSVRIGKTIDQKVNGTKLTVTGYYHDDRGGSAYYVSEATYLRSRMSSLNQLTISPSDKTTVYQSLRSSGVNVTDNYAKSKAAYKKSIRSTVLRAIAMAAVILVISLIEIYLMLRASFLSRVKEVGVLRAIGLKKGDIYRMFSGEVLALTILTAIPSMLVMSYFLYQLSKFSYFAASYRINAFIVLIGLAIVFVFNMIAGLLPVFRTLRKTPAAILSRNDVN